MTTTRERVHARAAFAATALLALFLLGPADARAQWTQPTPPDTSISNTNTGNVGVGTAAPASRLEVRGPANASTTILTVRPEHYLGKGFVIWPVGTSQANAIEVLDNYGGLISGFSMGSAGRGGHLGVAAAPSNVISALVRANYYSDRALVISGITAGGHQGHLTEWQDGASGASLGVFTATGRLGLGTSAPANGLHVHNGSAIGAIRVSGAGGGVMNFVDTGAAADAKRYQWRSEGGVFRMALVNDAENAYVRQNLLVANSSGNVGVGTSTPAYRLDVSGQIRSSSGGFVFPDGSVQTTAASGSSGGMAGVVAGDGLTGGGTSGTPTIEVGAGTGLTVAPDSISVNYGSAAGTAVQGNTTLTLTAGEGLSGGGTSTLGAGGTLTLANVDRGSAQNIFKNVANAAGVAQFSAGSNNDAISFEGTGGTTVTFNAAAKKVTIGSSTSGWTEASGGASLRTTNASASVGVGTASPLGPLSVGDASVAGSDGYLVIGKRDMSNGTRQFKVGFDQNFNFVIGDYGGNNVAATWRSPFAVNWDAPNASFYIDAGGRVGVGTASPAADYKLDVRGNVSVTGDIIATGNIAASFQDVAEWVPSTQKLQAGTVVMLDAGRTNHVVASAGAYDTKVAGVVSAQPGVILGVAGEGKVMVATTGRVKVRVDATRGAIKVGDLLVTSEVEGMAMKSVPVDLGGTQIHRPGTIIGKALEPLEKGTGEILVLLSLQ